MYAWKITMRAFEMVKKKLEEYPLSKSEDAC